MPADVEIANSALSLIGTSNFLTSLSDDTTEGRVCYRMLPISRKFVLRKHPWNFAEARETLAALTSTPAFGYTNEFQLPGDCLRVLSVTNGDFPHKIVGKHVHTDASSINLRYTFDETNYGNWDVMAAEVCAAHLAFKISYTVTGEQQIQRDLFNYFTQLKRDAGFVDSTEDPAPQVEADEWLESRETYRGDRGFVRDPMT